MLCEAFACFNSVSIAFSPSPDINIEDPQAAFDENVGFQALMQKSELLHLGLTSESASTNFHYALRVAHWPLLRTVELANLELDPVYLSDFLEKHSDTLREAKVSCISAPNRNTPPFTVMGWVRALTRMRHDLQLTKASIRPYDEHGSTQSRICEVVGSKTPFIDVFRVSEDPKTMMLRDFVVRSTPCGCVLCKEGGWKLKGPEDDRNFEQTGS